MCLTACQDLVILQEKPSYMIYQINTDTEILYFINLNTVL